MKSCCTFFIIKHKVKMCFVTPPRAISSSSHQISRHTQRILQQSININTKFLLTVEIKLYYQQNKVKNKIAIFLNIHCNYSFITHSIRGSKGLNFDILIFDVRPVFNLHSKLLAVKMKFVPQH